MRQIPKGSIKRINFILESSFSRCVPRIDSDPLLFLIYIHDLPKELKSNVKLFADDTSLFTVVKDKNEIANIINNNLLQISKWAYNWKMLFNPDPDKPTQEVLFSKKKYKFIQP